MQGVRAPGFDTPNWFLLSVLAMGERLKPSWLPKGAWAPRPSIAFSPPKIIRKVSTGPTNINIMHNVYTITNTTIPTNPFIQPPKKTNHADRGASTPVRTSSAS